MKSLESVVGGVCALTGLKRWEIFTSSYMTGTEVEEETDDMSDPELSRIKQEYTEEQTGWCPFLILHCWLLRNIKASGKKDLVAVK